MPINIKNFLLSQSKKSKIGDFQDLEHIDGVAISVVSANLYKNSRDDLVLFYFREGANYASVYTQSKIISENMLSVIFFNKLSSYFLKSNLLVLLS